MTHRLATDKHNRPFTAPRVLIAHKSSQQNHHAKGCVLNAPSVVQAM